MPPGADETEQRETAMTASIPKSTQAYGLTEPDARSVREHVERVFGVDAPAVWAQLTAKAGLPADVSGTAAVPALLRAMTGGGEVLALCASAVRIRAASFRELSAVREVLAAAR